MNFDKLNHWLTLLANIGVLIGIIVVAVQLQQTQTEMRAEASTTRTELLRETNNDAFAGNLNGLSARVENGEELSEMEMYQGRTFLNNVLRYLENLHYQNQIGVLDSEIWQGQLFTIKRMCGGDNALYSYLYPDGVTGMTYRASFRELINPPCDE